MKIKVGAPTPEACGVCSKIWYNSPGVSLSWCKECSPKMLKCIENYWKAKGISYVPK